MKINRVLGVFVDHSRATILLLILSMIYGMAAYHGIPKESAPDVKVPIIYVISTYRGISPEDAERLLLRPLENNLRTIEGIKEMTSYANEGSASVVMEFDAGFDSDKALQDVRAKVNDAESKFPLEADKSTIHEINLSLKPVLSVILKGDIPERSLLKIARDLRDKIEEINSVLEVKIGGDREEALEIIVEPAILESYGLSMLDITQIISSNNKLVAAGAIVNPGGEYSIKVPSLVEAWDDLLNFPIKSDKGVVVRLRDVATVKSTFKEAETSASVNGKSAIVLDVSKRTGKNIISTVNEIRKAVEEERQYLPSNLEILYSQDESTHIKDMVVELENSLILGVLLVLIVIILSVGVRSAMLIALSLPASFLSGILLLSAMDLTLNIVVLFSLILTVGMIVDDAIVVSEFADRKMIEGMPPTRAFLVAADRMMWPIITATLVKIMVFLPLLFWPGVIGQFMKYMPITVIAILSNSLLFALFFQPALGPLFGHSKSVTPEEAKAMEASESGRLEDLRGISKKYATLLIKVLEKPKTFTFSILGILCAVYVIFGVFGPGKEFFPKVEPNIARLVVQSPGNYSMPQKQTVMKEVEKRLQSLIGEVEVFYARAGTFIGEQNVPDDAIVVVQVEFDDWKTRRKASTIIADIEERLKGLPGVTFQIQVERAGPPSLKPIAFNISSRDYEKIAPFVDKVKAAMEKMGGFKNIEDSRSSNGLEARVITDRVMAARHLIDVGSIGNVVQLVSNGFQISSYRPPDTKEEVDILLRFPEEYRNLQMLQDLKMVTREGNVVPLSSFTEVQMHPKVGQIKRVDRQRVVTVEADVEEGVLADNQVQKLKNWIKENFDTDIMLTLKGDDEDQKEAGVFLINAFVVALLMMFVTMLVQFNNYYHTFIIMSAVFLSTVGVLLGLLITNQPFGIVMCGVGVIALAGIVLNNNILFVDTYQRLRASGLDNYKSVVMAGVQRMRPIVLTALTAILGLLPMVFGLTINFYDREISYDAPSSQWWRQLAASIAGGLAFATMLTLFFTPCLLLIGKRFDSMPKNDEVHNESVGES